MSSWSKNEKMYCIAQFFSEIVLSSLLYSLAFLNDRLTQGKGWKQACFCLVTQTDSGAKLNILLTFNDLFAILTRICCLKNREIYPFVC
jgi:hypothetical protein